MDTIRNNSAYPGFFPGLKILTGKYTNSDSSTHTVTIETGCTYVWFAKVHQLTGATAIACTIADSTAYPGTKKVTYTAQIVGTNSGISEYMIVGSNEMQNAFTAATDYTIVDFE